MDLTGILEAFNAGANLITAALIAWVVKEQKKSGKERRYRREKEANGDGN